MFRVKLNKSRQDLLSTILVGGYSYNCLHNQRLQLALISEDVMQATLPAVFPVYTKDILSPSHAKGSCQREDFIWNLQFVVNYS